MQRRPPKLVEAAGLNFNEFTAEFAEKGNWSLESYEKLAKGNIPKAMVDQFIEGQKAVGSRPPGHL